MPSDRKRSATNEPLYPRSTAAQLAHISLHLIRYCEREQIIEPCETEQGEEGYTAADIRQLARIRRLREDLGLDMGAVSVVLHLRRQVVDLLAEMEEIERRLSQREQELLREIQELRRRQAEDAHYGSS